jgi:hypothetical protein
MFTSIKQVYKSQILIQTDEVFLKRFFEKSKRIAALKNAVELDNQSKIFA